MSLQKYILTAACCCLMAACSSPQYKISLRDGRDYIAASKPSFIEKTGYYRYRELNGKDALVRADEVLFIREQ